MPLEIQNYKHLGKGYLQGTCDIKIPLWGNFIIYGISIFEKDGKKWISFPSREYEKEGQKKWFQHCRFESENMSEAFRNEFFKELDKYQKANNPSVFDVSEKQPKTFAGGVLDTDKFASQTSTQFPSNIQGKAKPSKEEECPF